MRRVSSFLKILSIAIILSIFTSCSKMSSIVNAPYNEGISQTFHRDFEILKVATLASMQNLNINIKQTKQTKDGFMIIFTKSISAFSWGEMGRVYVSKSQENLTNVYVYSKKRLKTQVTGADEKAFASKIFNGIREVLAYGRDK